MKQPTAIIVAALLGTLAASAHAQNATCQRSCLEGLLSDYLVALVAHDPAQIPTTTTVTYTENGQFVPIGTGEWLVAGNLGTYRHVFSDPDTQQVGAITTLTENDTPAIYVVRLKVEDGREISEIETQITRDAVGAGRYEEMGEPEDVWLAAVPEEDRIPRERLIAQTDKYYSGMERNDPNGNYSFFHQDCNRLEDGLKTTNQENGDPYGHSNDTAFASLGCEEQFQTGFLGFVTKIRDRRYPIVDEERQAVLAITIFDHNGTVRELPSINGTSNPIPPYFDVPRTLAASEAFRLQGEKLFRIEMTLMEVPYGMRTAYDAGPEPDLTSPGTNSSTTIPCDGSCLDSLLDRVISAMLTNDTTSLPLAPAANYSENGQFLAFGDGLWQTLKNVSTPGADAYAARFVDPSSGTAAYWGRTQEYSIPGVLALRVQVLDGKITAIEAVSVRAEGIGERGGTLTLMRPPLPVEWNGSSLGELDPAFQQSASTNLTSLEPALISYFDGYEKHDAGNVSFAPGCIRRDNNRQSNASCAAQMNGNGTTPMGLFEETTAVRDLRTMVTDESRGVVMAVAMVDYPASGWNGSVPRTKGVPSTYMVPQLIKFEDGSITRIEGMVKWVPYMYRSAWEESVEGMG